jgi:DNA-binding NarL/FixJ family response regulator
MSVDSEVRACTERMKAAYGEFHKVIVEDAIFAWRNKAWLTYGHTNWDTYCENEIGGRIMLTPAERKRAVAQMSDEGMSTRAIGKALGAHHSTVEADVEGGGKPPPQPPPRPG